MDRHRPAGIAPCPHHDAGLRVSVQFGAPQGRRRADYRRIPCGCYRARCRSPPLHVGRKYLMRALVLAAALMAAAPFAAQAQPQADPQTQALGATVMDLTSQNVGLRAQLIAAQEKIKALEAEKTKPVAPKAAKAP